jgi:hypothetical protein
MLLVLVILILILLAIGNAGVKSGMPPPDLTARRGQNGGWECAKLSFPDRH